MKSSLTELSNMEEKGKLAFEFAKEFCEVINDINSDGDSIHNKIISIFRTIHFFCMFKTINIYNLLSKCII